MGKDFENQFKEVVNALADGFRKESDEKFGPIVQMYLQEHPFLDITDPEQFNLLTALTLDEQREVLSRIALNDMEIESEKQHKLEFVYENYSFLESHLESIILSYEGHACSADKTRWLINVFANYLKTDKTPSVNEDEKHYWLPEILDVSLWVNWMDSIIDLYYGREEKYVALKTELKNKYQSLIDEQLDKMDKGFKSSEYFVSSKEVIKRDEKKKEYVFFDEKTGNKGTIYLDKIAHKSYRFYFEEEDRFAKFKDTLPVWFDNILKTQ